MSWYSRRKPLPWYFRLNTVPLRQRLLATSSIIRSQSLPQVDQTLVQGTWNKCVLLCTKHIQFKKFKISIFNLINELIVWGSLLLFLYRYGQSSMSKVDRLNLSPEMHRHIVSDWITSLQVHFIQTLGFG